LERVFPLLFGVVAFGAGVDFGLPIWLGALGRDDGGVTRGVDRGADARELRDVRGTSLASLAGLVVGRSNDGARWVRPARSSRSTSRLGRGIGFVRSTGARELSVPEARPPSLPARSKRGASSSPRGASRFTRGAEVRSTVEASPRSIRWVYPPTPAPRVAGDAFIVRLGPEAETFFVAAGRAFDFAIASGFMNSVAFGSCLPASLGALALSM